MLCNVVAVDLELDDGVSIAQCAQSDGPVTGAVGASGQLEAVRVGQTQLDAHRLVHPVVACELGAVDSLGVGVGAVVAVVSPDGGLHTGTQLAVAAGQVNADGLAEAAHILAAFHGDDQTLSGLLSLAGNAGARALLCSREGVAVAALDGGLQAVGVLVNGCGQGVGVELIFGIAAHQLPAVLHDAVLGAEVVQVRGGNADRNVLGADDLVVVHLSGGAVSLGDGALVPLDRGAIVQVDGLAVLRPVRDSVGGAVGGIDDSRLLEAAAVQAVVGGSTGNSVESALVVLIVAVQLSGRSGAAGIADRLICPVFAPGQSSVQVGVAGAKQAVLAGVRQSGERSGGQQAEGCCDGEQQRKHFLRFHENTPFSCHDHVLE